MNKITVSEDDLRGLFTQLKQRSEGFKKIDSRILEENPKLLLVLRLAANMSIEQFAKFTKRSPGTISYL